MPPRRCSSLRQAAHQMRSYDAGTAAHQRNSIPQLEKLRCLHGLPSNVKLAANLDAGFSTWRKYP